MFDVAHEPADHASALIDQGHSQSRAWKVASVNDSILRRLAESDDPKLARAAKAEQELRSAER